ncbi:MAG TPA: hypothetical protein VFV22_02155 [Candidatus Paceibacterota bacterium]|nr:hypothetical protein [Candidatus Paceibacterota bacterium]
MSIRIFYLVPYFTLFFLIPFFSLFAETGGGNVSGGAREGGSRFSNPLNAEDITQFLVQIIDIMLVFAIPIIVLFIMYGGYKLVVARGEGKSLEEGRNAIFYAIIGGVIVLAAKLIIEVIQSTVGALEAA